MAESTDGQAISKSEIARSTWDSYLIENSLVYRELAELRRQGWQNRDGDTHFAHQRQRADNPTAQGKARFFAMMEQIGDEMDSASSILTLPDRPPFSRPRVLDLCFSPGGFVSSIMKRNPNALIYGVTLPVSLGGHEIMLPRWRENPRLHVKFCDLTMRAADMGVDASMIPEGHPDRANFDFSTRLFAADSWQDTEVDETFDLVICDGQVLRTHAPMRAAYRENREASRLTLAQLVIGIQRLRKVGNSGHRGRLVMLLHKVDALDTAWLLRTISTFAKIRLFKPRHKHALRSSFYLLATEVRADSDEAAQAINEWRKDWAIATLGTEHEWIYRQNEKLFNSEAVSKLTMEFGQELIRLGEPVWRTQTSALKKAPFIPAGQKR
ncbi:hypothetical protein F5X96DRAFT_411131 [Biscogniauxia mediterranea]|nr:hypothetical protein F5X96DRAFT_411131 [Biscogniauxia mediterranea]